MPAVCHPLLDLAPGTGEPFGKPAQGIGATGILHCLDHVGRGQVAVCDMKSKKPAVHLCLSANIRYRMTRHAPQQGLTVNSRNVRYVRTSFLDVPLPGQDDTVVVFQPLRRARCGGRGRILQKLLTSKGLRLRHDAELKHFQACMCLKVVELVLRQPVWVALAIL